MSTNIKQLIEQGWKQLVLTENFYKTRHHPSLTREQYKHLEENLFHAIEHFDIEREKAKANPPGFAMAVHREVEDNRKKMDPVQKKEITCKKGCSFCCYLNVDITSEEAELLLAYADEFELPIDLEKLERQSKFRETNWIEQKFSDRKCIFLSDKGECNAYEVRPLSCRNHLVASNPKNCDTNEHNGARIKKVNIWQVELITSAILTISETGNMATMLLKAKKENEKTV